MNQFNQLVESLKRLFKNNKIDEEKINQLVQKGTITEEEKNYILRKEETDVHNTN